MAVTLVYACVHACACVYVCVRLCVFACVRACVCVLPSSGNRHVVTLMFVDLLSCGD